MYRPIGFVLGAAASGLAGFLFRRAWHALSDEDSVPDPADEQRTWSEVLAAAALQGLIFAVVKASVDRAGLAGARRLTGDWPA